MVVTDEQIRDAVNALFAKYDKDKSGYVQGNEIYTLFNDLTKELQVKKQYKKQEIDQILATTDKNQDMRISKDQLFVVMRKINQ